MPISQAGVFAGMNPASFNASDPIALFIIQAVIILCLCRLISIPLGYLRQPRVISEVIAGILLGPTVMGRIPNFQQSIFPSESLSYLNLISTLGLVFFLFQVGLEVDLRVIKRDWKKSATIAVVGMVIPFGLGCAVSLGLYNLQGDPTVPFGSFLLFLGVALSITAFPVLARILAELKLLKTQVGAITMAAGLVNDCTAWVLLALVVALLNSNEGLEALYVFLTAVGFSLFLIFLIGPLYYKLCVYTRFEKGPSPLLMTVTLMIALISAFVTDIIGIHPIFGGFLAGVIIPHEHDLPIKITEKIEDVVNIIFLPLYFTLSGLKTQIGLLNTGPVWGYVILVIFLACFGKIVGCTIAARLCGINNRESLTIGFLMNCKGLVELIVLNIGHDAGVLNDQVFAILVVMALITTFMTTPMVIYLYPEGSRNEVYGSSSTVDVLKDEEKWGTQIKTYRVITILNRFESLAPAMTLLQLFDTDKVKIHALRLLELTQRTSDVMKSKNEPHDPILKVLKTFANVIGINLKPHIEYAQDDIKSLSDCAMEIKADMVILPWISEEPNEIFYRAYQTINTCPVAVFVDNGFGVAQHATPRIIVVCEENDDSPLRFALKLQSLHKAEILVLGTHLKSQWATRDSVRRFMEGTEDELFISQTKSNVESKHVEQLRAKQIIDSSEPMSHDIIVISRRLQLDPDSSTHSALGLTAKELLAGHVILAIEDDTSLFKDVDGRDSIDEEDGIFESMQHITEQEEYFDGDSSLNEMTNFDDEEYNTFQNADTSEYFDNLSHQQDDLIKEEQQEDNTVIDQHNDEQPIIIVPDFPLSDTDSTGNNIPWQRAEPKRSQENYNEFYQDTPIAPNTTPHKKMNIIPTKSHTDSNWTGKEEKDYSLPLHNRHFKSEIKNC